MKIKARQDSQLPMSLDNYFSVDPDGVAHVDVWYPGTFGDGGASAYHTVEIGLVDVRAADGLRIRYDLARDGWSIAQSDGAEQPDWQEVAFVPAWGRERKEEA